MSRNPPIGINYLTDETEKYHKENDSQTVTYPEGFKQAIPRIYKTKLFNDQQKRENQIEIRKIIHDKDKKLKVKYGKQIRTRKEAVEDYKKFKLKQKLKRKHD